MEFLSKIAMRKSLPINSNHFLGIPNRSIYTFEDDVLPLSQPPKSKNNSASFLSLQEVRFRDGFPLVLITQQDINFPAGKRHFILFLQAATFSIFSRQKRVMKNASDKSGHSDINRTISIWWVRST